MDAGRIVRVPFPVDDNPGKKKYVICVEPHQGFFFLISSHKRRYTPASVEVTPDELPFLTTDSHINAGEVYEFHVGALDTHIADYPDDDLGMLPAGVRQRVREAVETLGRTLSPQQKQAILNHL